MLTDTVGLLGIARTLQRVGSTSARAVIIDRWFPFLLGLFGASPSSLTAVGINDQSRTPPRLYGP